MQSATDKATAVKKTQETKKKAAPKRKSAAGKDEGEDKSKKATPKKATPKKKQGGKKGGDKNGEVLKQFQQHVNMDEDELKVRLRRCGRTHIMQLFRDWWDPACLSWKPETEAKPVPAISSMSPGRRMSFR